MLRRTSPAPHPHPLLLFRFGVDEPGKKNRALQSTQAELHRQVKTDSLKKGLERRIDKKELIERTSPLEILGFRIAIDTCNR